MTDILLVEDDPDDVHFLRRAVAKAGIRCAIHLARDGAEGQDYLAGEGEFRDRVAHPLPDLILLDIKMPRRTGLEMLEWMQERGPLRAIPVVVLTSSREPNDVRRAHELGILAYCIKPFEVPALQELLQAVFHWIIDDQPMPENIRKAHCLGP